MLAKYINKVKKKKFKYLKMDVIRIVINLINYYKLNIKRRNNNHRKTNEMNIYMI